tara:strand:- start:418 stop:726 length:309 start_codon:yes stop_codon:yes gene_type:complete
MRSYYTITSATTTTLRAIGSKATDGNIRAIRLTNSHASTVVTIKLTISDGTNTYIIAHQDIPARSSVVLKDLLSYDGTLYRLILSTVSAAIDASNPLTVIME